MHLKLSTSAEVSRLVLIVQHRPVLLDADLARVLGLPIRRLRRLVWEHYEQFPGELCFQPEAYEIPTDSPQRHANVFTEQGVWMIATVLGTRHALDTAAAVSRACATCREQRRFTARDLLIAPTSP